MYEIGITIAIAIIIGDAVEVVGHINLIADK